jgi:hypothetical protein
MTLGVAHGMAVYGQPPTLNDKTRKVVIDVDNNQALGYMLLACKELGYTKEQARELYKAMYYQFDMKTEGEAEKQGFEWYYEDL